MEIKEIVNKIIKRLEDDKDDISVIWPTNRNSKLTREKFIDGITYCYTEGISLYKAFGYKGVKSSSTAINKIITIKNKPKQVMWKQYFINIINLKLCPHCNEIKELDNFSMCKTNKNGKDCWCKSCNNIKNRMRRQETKKHILSKYFQLSCELCGYNKNLSVLEIHHIEDLIRPVWAVNSTPNDYLYGSSLKLAEKRINIELDNLAVLCSNCHREQHATSAIDNQKGLKEALEELNIRYICEECGEESRLHLHHNNPEEKEVSFSTFSKLTKKRILIDGILEKEMKKDVSILCANHHGERHNPNNNIGDI